MFSPTSYIRPRAHVRPMEGTPTPAPTYRPNSPRTIVGALRLAVRVYLVALLVGTCALLYADVAHATPTPTPTRARAVALTDARVLPDFIASVRPRAIVTVENQCGRGRWFTEYSAYGADGSAIGAQHWSRGEDRVWWRVPGRRGGRVVFDGITFRNASGVRVLIAGWCG